MTKSFRIGPFRLAPYKRSGKRKETWLVDIPASLAGGRRHRKFFDNRNDATRFARELDRRYRRGDLSGVRPQEREAPILGAVVEDWLAFQALRVRTAKKRPSSLASDRYRLRAVLAEFGADPLPAITEERIAAFRAARLAQSLAPATVNADVRVPMKVLRWARRKGRLAVLPEVERIPEVLAETAVPTQAEVQRIIGHLPEHLRPLVRLIAQTGCRSGEARNLTWDRVDLEACTVTFRPAGDWTPKTRSSIRRVPISDDFAAELAALPREGVYVFPGKTPGRPIREFKRAFRTAVARADIRRNGKPIRITPHTLRKATATWLAVDQGVPQRVLQSILGHVPGSAVTDKYYVSASDEAKRRALGALSI